MGVLVPLAELVHTRASEAFYVRPFSKYIGVSNRSRLPMAYVPTTRLLACALLTFGGSAFAVRADDLNDYPTAARADYVFGCMKANGETRHTLDQCSCSIDTVASLLPYERYVTAETVLSMAQVRGNLGGQFRSSEQATSALNDLRRAQAEAEVRCF